MTGGRAAARETARFSALALGISWGIGIPTILGDRSGWLPPPVVGVGLGAFILGPAVSALTLATRDGGRSGPRRLVGRFRDRPSSTWWWLAVPGAAAAAAVTASGPLRQGDLPAPGADALVSAVLAAPAVLVAAALEELGWRGYLLPRIQRWVRPVVASVLIGVPWGIWHVPLLLLPGGANSQVPLWAYPASALAGSFMYTGLFNATGGSLAIVTAVHGVRNIVSGIFLAHQAQDFDPTAAYAADVALTLLAGVTFLAATRGRPPVVEAYGTPRSHIRSDLSR